MDVLQNDDELLLKELERKDGIYSFIFKELETTKLEKECVDRSLEISADLQKNTRCQWIIKDLNSRQSATEAATFKVNKKPLLYSATNPNTTKSVSFKTYSFTSCKESWQSNFNQQFSTAVKSSTSLHPAFQQLQSLHSLNVRKAKSPFSHIHEPLIRNRRHKLKETKEYTNFINSVRQVTDLRELFPLDPDVHAPFKELKESGNDKNFIRRIAKD